MSDLLTVSCRRHGATAQIILDGELDLSTVPLAENAVAALEDTGVTQLIIDLRRLTFMDSTGLRFALRLDAAARRDGHDVAFVRGPVTDRLFELSGLSDHFVFVDAPVSPGDAER